MKKSNATSSMVTCLISVWLLYGCIAMGIEVPQPYTVTQGDTLYELSGFKLGNPNLWKQIVEKNSFLKEKGRMFLKADGTVVVIIKPNEKIMGLEGVVTPQLLSESEITKYLNVQKKPVAPQTPQVNQESTTTVMFVNGLFLVVALLFLTALVVMAKDFFRPNDVAFFGKPMRNWFKRFLRLPPSLAEAFATFERIRETEGGSLAEIYEARLSSAMTIPTEFADGEKEINYKKDAVYVGVFRNKKSEIVEVSMFAKYCTNGILLHRMDNEIVRSIFTNSMIFENAKRIATPSGYQGAENFGSVEAWLRNKYEATTTLQTSTTEDSTPETSPTPETITEDNIKQLEKVTDKLDSVIAKIENAILGDDTNKGEEKINAVEKKEEPPSTTEKERQGFHIVGIEPIRTHAVTASIDCTETINKNTGEKMVGLMINKTTLDLIGEIEKGSFTIRDKHDKRILIEFSNDGVRMTPVVKPKRKTEKQREKDARDYIADLTGTKRT